MLKEITQLNAGMNEEKKKMKNYFAILIFIFGLTSAYAQISNLNTIVNNVNIDSLTYFVKELSGVVSVTVNGVTSKIESRHKNNPDNNKAANYLYQKLKSYNLEVTKQVFSSTGYNIIGTKIGTKYPNQKVIICAHFDNMPTGLRAPGADDNASGTAAVLEAARILSPLATPYTMVFALWDEEEQGLIGSEYYAMKAANNYDSIIAVINMDMIAWNRTNTKRLELHTNNSTDVNDLVNRIVNLNLTLNLGLNTVIINPGARYSDHASFWDYNFAATLIIEDDNDFNAYYHTIGDTLGNFNFDYFHRAAKLAIAAFYVYASDYIIRLIHNPIVSSDDPNSLYTEVTVESSLPVKRPIMYYRVNEGSGFGDFIKLYGEKLSLNNKYYFIIPSINLGSLIEYYIAVEDSNNYILTSLPTGATGNNPAGYIPPPKLYAFYYMPKVELFTDEFNDNNNWNFTNGFGLTDQSFISSPKSATDSPMGNYSSNANASMVIKNPIYIPNSFGIELTYYAYWQIEHAWDYAMCQISTDNGANWIPLEGNYTNIGSGSFQPNNTPLYDGKSNGWVKEKVSLNLFKGKNVLLGFILRSDGALEFDGIYIDDVKITSFEKPTNVENNDNLIINSYQLYQNYPNPFNPNTIISYQIPFDGIVTLKVTDILGKDVAVLVNEYKNKGLYNINFDASNLSSGVYIYSLTCNNFNKAKKMILIK